MLHKSKDFPTNISNLFFKGAKISIQKVIGSKWIHKCKGKLNGGSLKAFEVQDKPNLNKIFKSYLGYRDLEGLHTLH